MKYDITTNEGEKYTVKPRLALYSHEAVSKYDTLGLAIVLDDVTEGKHYAMPYISLTANFDEFIEIKNCAYVDTKMTDLADQLIRLGIARDTGLYKEGGSCVYPLYEFDENFLKESGAEIYEKYSQAYDEYIQGPCIEDECDSDDMTMGI